MMRRLLVRIENRDAGLQKKSSQDCLIARSLSAYCKPGAQFSKNDEREPDFVCQFDSFDDS